MESVIRLFGVALVRRTNWAPLSQERTAAVVAPVPAVPSPLGAPSYRRSLGRGIPRAAAAFLAALRFRTSGEIGANAVLKDDEAERLRSNYNNSWSRLASPLVLHAPRSHSQTSSTRTGKKYGAPRLNHFMSLGPQGFHRIAYTEWGNPANPNIVLCVHGLTRNSRDFDALAAGLSRDFRVVCMDVAGRGGSDWMQDKRDYGFSLYQADAAALLARVTAPALLSSDSRRNDSRDPAHIHQVDWIGTSMGGLIGMMLAAKANSPIRQLVMNDVGPFILGSDLRQGLNMWPVWDKVQCATLVLRGAQSNVLEQATCDAMGKRKPATQVVEFPEAGHAPWLASEDQIRIVRDFLLMPTSSHPNQPYSRSHS